MIAWILSLILPLSFAWGSPVMVPAPPAQVSSETTEEEEWKEFHTMAYNDHADAFTALFNSYETKWSKNGRLMIRQGSTGPYKFTRKGV